MRLTVGARLALVAAGTALVAAGVLSGLLAWQLSDSGQREAEAVTRSVTVTIVHEPGIADLVRAEDSARLQPFAEQIMADADVSFVTIMTPEAIRLTHRDPEEIGRPYLGTTSAALAGDTLTEVYSGTLGPSVRTIAPIRDGDEIVGLVSVGETLGSVRSELAPRVPLIVVAAIAIAALGLLGALFVGRAARRVTGPLTPEELTRLVENYETVLHSLREGLVVTDGSGRIRLYNDEAADLLGLAPATAGPIDLDPADTGMAPALRDVLASGRRAVEETIVAGDRVLLVNQEDARDLDGRRAPERGRVMTLRDRSELQALLGELEGVRMLSATLRAQTHEHGNRLHTVLALLELGRVDDARALLVESTASRQGLTDRLIGSSDDSAVAALLLGKLDDAAERGVDLVVDVAERVRGLGLPAAEAVTVVGNLVDNALDAVAATVDGERWVRVALRVEGEAVVLEVSDGGPGFDAALGDPFAWGASTKSSDAAAPRGVGLALVRDIVTSRGGRLEMHAAPTRVRVVLPGRPT